jgi:hypothetical protein
MRSSANIKWWIIIVLLVFANTGFYVLIYMGVLTTP